jgi:branched-subunit amino acid transport protein
MTWVAVLALAALCVFMRVAVPLGLGDRRPAWLERALVGAQPALLAAFVVVGAVGGGQRLVVDERLAGLLVAGAVVAVRGSLLLAVLSAAAVTALLRA